MCVKTNITINNLPKIAHTPYFLVNDSLSCVVSQFLGSWEIQKKAANRQLFCFMMTTMHALP
jgi:hypothetical protein